MGSFEDAYRAEGFGKDDPQWTTTPPTEPGWYFQRYANDHEFKRPVYIDGSLPEWTTFEWWPIRIEEPLND